MHTEDRRIRDDKENRKNLRETKTYGRGRRHRSIKAN
jgi:hypothetical protein